MPTTPNKRKAQDTALSTVTTPKRQKIDFDDTITVLVGQKKQSFVVHKAVLTRSSEYLKAALKTQWTNGSSKLELQDADPELFQQYVNWLYLRKTENNYTTAYRDKTYYYPTQTTLTSLFIFADKIVDNRFCNALLDAYVDLWSNHPAAPQAKTVNKVWTVVPVNSPLRKLFLDGIVQQASRDWFTNCLKQSGGLHEDFLRDYIEALLTAKDTVIGTSPKMSKRMVREKYHLHAEIDDSDEAVDTEDLENELGQDVFAISRHYPRLSALDWWTGN